MVSANDVIWIMFSWDRGAWIWSSADSQSPRVGSGLVNNIVAAAALQWGVRIAVHRYRGIALTKR